MMAGLAREGARDFYYAALFAPSPKREALWAIAAFHAEVSNLRAKTRQAIAGEVRLQWWVDSFKAGDKSHPVLKALADIAYLPKQTLINKIEAHVFDLYDDGHADKSEMEGYYGETLSSLFMLNALVLNEGKPVNEAELAGFAGVAYGLWRDNKSPEPYRQNALALYKACPKHLKPAFMPLLLTGLNQKAGDLRKLFRYSTGI